MAIYIALLRAVNVGGNNLVRMAQLRQWCAELGWENVRTYLQSGNVVFQTRAGITKWQAALEQKLAAEINRPIGVIGRTPAELEQVICSNPFAADPGIHPSKLHTAFLASAPPSTALELLATLRAVDDRLAVGSREIYFHCPGSYGETKLSNTAIEKALALQATTRNWNTVKKLFQTASE